MRIGRIPSFLALLCAAVLSASGPAFAAGCALNSASRQIQHVIYVEFDKVHFTRDIPSVPSDLEQMPNLLNFILSNGTLLTNHHTRSSPILPMPSSRRATTLPGVRPARPTAMA